MALVDLAASTQIYSLWNIFPASYGYGFSFR